MGRLGVPERLEVDDLCHAVGGIVGERRVPELENAGRTIAALDLSGGVGARAFRLLRYIERFVGLASGWEYVRIVDVDFKAVVDSPWVVALGVVAHHAQLGLGLPSCSVARQRQASVQDVNLICQR